MYSIEQIQLGAADYFDNEFLPKLNKGILEKIAIGALIGAVLSRADRVVEFLKENPILNMAGIVSENGQVDIELLKNEFCRRMGSEGIPIDIPKVGKVTFYNNDIESLFQYIQRRA